MKNKALSVSRTLCMILSIILMLGMTGCETGGKSDKNDSAAVQEQDSTSEEGNSAAGQEQESGAVDEQSAQDGNAGDDAAESVVTAEAPVYGNDPNNLFQLSQTPCFGDGRVYYVNFNDEMASFALDGSDAKVNGTIANIPGYSSGARFLNWYAGSVYYKVAQEREDYSSYFEIRKMDPASGAEEVVLTTVDDDPVSSTGMIIIGDDLFYSCFDATDRRTTVYVMDLVSGDRNQLFSKVTSGAGSNNVVVTSDGQSFYLIIPDTVGKIYRLSVSELYGSDPECEQIAAFSTTSVIFTESGFYTGVQDPDTNSNNYVFYAYSDAGADWSGEVVKEDLIADGEMGTEEGIINNLIWYSEKWMLGDAMASVSQMSKNLYYSSTVDYANSASVGELAFERSAANGTGKYIGAYEDVLYVICQDGEEISFHTLTSDGTYQ